MTQRSTPICALVTLIAASLACSDGSVPLDAASSDATSSDATLVDASSDGVHTDTPPVSRMDAQSDSADPPSDAPPLEAGLIAIDAFLYRGAFRIASSDFGESNVNSAVGTLGYNPERRSLYIAGHPRERMIAEFAIPRTLGEGLIVEELPIVEEALQDFASVLNRAPSGNPDEMDRITGMYWADGDLIVNANRVYDAAGRAEDTTLIVRDGDLSGTTDGYYQLDGAALAAGFMAPIPAELQDALGGPVLTGWASNYSIKSRYSIGPTLFAFDPAAIPEGGGRIATVERMNFAHRDGVFLGGDDVLESECSIADEVTTCEDGARASPLWNHVAKAKFGFIVPGTRTYALFGRMAGTETGIGYKLVQDNGNLCSGYCAYGAADRSNYYWLFDVQAILDAPETSDPLPYAYGRWSLPFDVDGAHDIVGGAYAEDESRLYISLGRAGQVGEYDRPPLILGFDIDVP